VVVDAGDRGERLGQLGGALPRMLSHHLSVGLPPDFLARVQGVSRRLGASRGGSARLAAAQSPPAAERTPAGW
jgi:hypothetical protein